MTPHKGSETIMSSSNDEIFNICHYVYGVAWKQKKIPNLLDWGIWFSPKRYFASSGKLGVLGLASTPGERPQTTEGRSR